MIFFDWFVEFVDIFIYGVGLVLFFLLFVMVIVDVVY